LVIAVLYFIQLVVESKTASILRISPTWLFDIGIHHSRQEAKEINTLASVLFFFWHSVSFAFDDDDGATSSSSSKPKNVITLLRRFKIKEEVIHRYKFA
jgi:hypothetical protein